MQAHYKNAVSTKEQQYIETKYKIFPRIRKFCEYLSMNITFNNDL